MSKSIKGIIISILIILLLILVTFVIPTLMANEELFEDKMVKESTIVIDSDGILKCEDIIKINPNEDYVVIPLAIYKDSDEGWKGLKINSVMIDDKSIEPFHLNKNGLGYVTPMESDLHLVNMDSYMGEKHIIKINYEYTKTENIITKYNDLTLMELYSSRDYDDYKLKIILPEENANIKAKEPFISVKKESNNSWTIDMMDVKSSKNEAVFFIENCNMKNVRFVDSDYYDSFWSYSELAKSNVIFQKMFFIILGIEIIMGVTLIIISKKRKVKKEYIRDTKNVVEPILAEAIIDQKIGVKELVMASIANLIYKGNLECIDNNNIRLVHKNNLSEYEKDIINITFDRCENVNFEFLKNIFSKENITTKRFYESFKRIKENILNILFEKGIYSKRCEKILKIIKFVSKMIYVEIVYLFYILFFQVESTIFNFGVINIFGILLILFGKKILKAQEYDSFRPMTKVFSLLFILPVLLGGLYLLSQFYADFGMLLIVILIFINTIVLKKTNTHVFTKNGKTEYKKVYGLKAYINDYSLMKDRELESSILWDDYLSYAIAFGISNKVTKRFGEDVMNKNITLQNIDNILKF